MILDCNMVIAMLDLLFNGWEEEDNVSTVQRIEGKVDGNVFWGLSWDNLRATYQTNPFSIIG